MQKSLSPIDHMVLCLDNALQTLFSTPPMSRENPASDEEESLLDENDQKHAAGLMRVNHSGEVCAQALYQGQALTAKSEQVKIEMKQSSIEENDHLAWCESRIKELNSHTSYLNPLWYGGSFILGATAGLIGDKWSLGFVAETERQVVDHLDRHLDRLPVHDLKSRKIVEQMKVDEGEHATKAIEVGAVELPGIVKKVMGLTSKIMTSLAYRI